jgi:8-oxo-dGTP diphosphatase
MQKEVAAAIIHNEDKILICQRASKDECAMQWEFPGGKREEETIEQCIIREIKEELELEIEVMDIFDTSIYHYAENEIHFTVFDARITGGEMKLNVHNDAKWVTVDQLGLFEFMPADIEFVEKLMSRRR